MRKRDNAAQRLSCGGGSRFMTLAAPGNGIYPWLKRTIHLALCSQRYSVDAIRSHRGASLDLHWVDGWVDGHDHVLSYPALTVW